MVLQKRQQQRLHTWTKGSGWRLVRGLTALGWRRPASIRWALLTEMPIDGCSPLGEWWNVMIPAARSDLITLAMFVFIGSWSDFLWPLIILDDPGLYTLPLGLQQLASSFSLDWRLVAAGSVVSILPVLVLFVLLQRYILPSASGDAVKG
jgi:ABC-type glycerol-3-phosphate transport system permease component